jgi:hypothetical protein
MIHRALYFIATILLACSTADADEMRRVVTGLDESNKAIILFDSHLPLTGNRNPQVQLWSTNSSPAGFSFNDDRRAGSLGPPNPISPPDNGSIFRAIEFQPLAPGAESKTDPNLCDEGGRRSRSDQGFAGEASANASYPDRGLRLHHVR